MQHILIDLIIPCIAGIFSAQKLIRFRFIIFSLAAIGIMITCNSLLFAEPQFPSMGFEIELTGIDVYNYDSQSNKFTKVEEKTDFCKIFKTAGNSPQLSKYALFNITVDNAHTSTPEELSNVVKEIEYKFDLPGTKPPQQDHLVYAHGDIELATGPLPYDAELHNQVRKALNLFIDTLFNKCEEKIEIDKLPPSKRIKVLNKIQSHKENQYSKLCNAKDILALYNAGLKDKVGSYWDELLKLEEYDTKNNFYFCLQNRNKEGQATFGIPVEKILPLRENNECDFAQNLVNSDLDLNKNAMKPEVKDQINSLLYLWGLITDCARSNFTACAANKWINCSITCNKNKYNYLPHVDVSELYQKMRSQEDIQILESESTKDTLQSLIDANIVQDKEKNTNDYKPSDMTYSTLLSPFDPDERQCKKYFPKGFYHYDSAKIDVLDLKTQVELVEKTKVGIAVEDRKSLMNTQRVNTVLLKEITLKAPYAAADKYFIDWRDRSESKEVKCSLKQDTTKLPKIIYWIKCESK